MNGGSGADLVIIYGDVDFLDPAKAILAHIHKAGSAAIPSNRHSICVHLVFDWLAYPYEITLRFG